MMGKHEWRPLADNEYAMQGFGGRTYTLRVCFEGRDLEAWSDDNILKDGTPIDIEEIGVGDYRLCQAVEIVTPAALFTPERIHALKIGVEFLQYDIDSGAWITKAAHQVVATLRALLEEVQE